MQLRIYHYLRQHLRDEWICETKYLFLERWILNAYLYTMKSANEEKMELINFASDRFTR